MRAKEKGLKAAIKGASAFVQESTAKSETAALNAVERTQAAFAEAQSKWNDARELSGEVADGLGHVGRTTISGLVEAGSALGRYSKDAITDTIEMGRKSMSARNPSDVVVLYIDFLTRRSQAMFASVGELNAIAQSKTAAAWSPLGKTVRKAVKAA